MSASVASECMSSSMAFIKEGVKADIPAKVKILKEHDLPWASESFHVCYELIQKRHHATHQNWQQLCCRTHFVRSRNENIWPPSSPNLRPVDFAARCVVKMDVCAAPHSSASILKQTQMTATSNFVKNVLRRSGLSEMNNMDAVVKVISRHVQLWWCS